MLAGKGNLGYDEIVNPIIRWVVAHTASRARLRRCTKCGETQLVPASKLTETVSCASCRAPLPPPRPQR